MHRVDSDGYVTEGGLRRFADQNLPTLAGTLDGAEWNNAVQEEICNAIEASGLTLNTDATSDRADGWNQLATAIFNNHAIGTDALANLSVNANKLAANAVTNDKIQNDAVSATKLASNAVTSTKIQNGAVELSKIAVGAKNVYRTEDGSQTFPTTGDVSGMSVTVSPSYTVKCSIQGRCVATGTGTPQTLNLQLRNSVDSILVSLPVEIMSGIDNQAFYVMREAIFTPPADGIIKVYAETSLTVQWPQISLIVEELRMLGALNP